MKVSKGSRFDGSTVATARRCFLWRFRQSCVQVDASTRALPQRRTATGRMLAQRAVDSGRDALLSQSQLNGCLTGAIFSVHTAHGTPIQSNDASAMPLG